MFKPIVWSIAGFDPSGGAGVQTDMQVFQHLGVHGCSIITAITAQNSQSVDFIQYNSEYIDTQISSLQNELAPKVIKLGMLGHAATLAQVGNYLRQNQVQVVLDPVMIATSGKHLFLGDIHEYISQLIKLFPAVDLITPNLSEAEAITGQNICSYADMEKAALHILTLGVKSVLIKGGHFHDAMLSQDYWTNGEESYWLSSARYPQKNYRGTGCVFSAAIAACLGLNYAMKDAIVIAKMYINRAIRLAYSLNEHTGFLTHAGWPEDAIDMPFLSHSPISALPSSFNDCGPSPLGLYPVVDSSEWLKKLLPMGVKTIQLRIKNKNGHELENEINNSIQLAKKFGCRLFINDYWELAMAYGAYGVHLGQEDLDHADVVSIQQAGLRLGISTHCYYEVARAHAYKPSYLACGPIFPTTSKIMAFQPQGIDNLNRWCRTLNHYQLVAIGGIDEENIHDVLGTGVNGIALISAVTKANDPIAKTLRLLQIMRTYQ